MEKTIGAFSKEQFYSSLSTIPNLLCFLRIAATPVVVLFLFFPGPLPSFCAALCFLIASMTDMLDGYLARLQKCESPIGRLLDPLADKILINSAMIMLIPLERIPAWMVVLIIGREVAVTGLRGIAALQNVVIEATQWGKAKTILQCAALVGLILHYEYFGIDFHILGMILMWIALVITLASGVDYFLKFYRESVHEKPTR
jgi:CDP-diacylglycerol--glycerol-3-phosphate 3-phosphatidyltransferase